MNRISTIACLLLGTACFVPHSASAQSREAAIERCRASVGRPIVQACMRSRGATIDSQSDLAACRTKATPQVRSCVMAAMGGKNRGAGAKSGSGLADGSRGNDLPVGSFSDIPNEFPTEGGANALAIGATIQINLSIHQTLSIPEGRRFFSRTETNLRVKLVSNDTLEMTRTRVAFDANDKKVASEPEFTRSFKLGEAVDTPAGKTSWSIDHGRLANVFTVDGAAGRTIIDFSGSKDDLKCRVFFGYSREEGSEKIMITSLTGNRLEVLNAKAASADCQIKR